MKKIFFVTFLILLGISFLCPYKVLTIDDEVDSEEISAQLQAVTGEKGASFGAPEDPRMMVVNIIKAALAFLGTIFLVYIFYAGFIWMTAGGEEEKVKTAQKIIKYAVIGTLIVLCSYSIAIFVQKYLYEAQNADTRPSGWFFEAKWGVEKDMSDYYPGGDPLDGSAFIPGYENVFPDSDGEPYKLW